MIPASAHAGAAVPVDHEGLAVARGGLPLDGRSALFGRQRVDRVGDDGDLGRGGGAGQQRKHFLRPVPGPERREVHTHPRTVVVRPRRGHHRVDRRAHRGAPAGHIGNTEDTSGCCSAAGVILDSCAVGSGSCARR